MGSLRAQGCTSPSLAASQSLPSLLPCCSGSAAARRQKVSAHLFLKGLRRSSVRGAAATASFLPTLPLPTVAWYLSGVGSVGVLSPVSPPPIPLPQHGEG